MSVTDASTTSDPRRARVRSVAQRVTLAAELLATGAGGLGAWQAHAAGQAMSRPAAIALGAGLVGLAAGVIGPRVRAWVRRRRTGA